MSDRAIGIAGIALTVVFGIPTILNLLGIETYGVLTPYIPFLSRALNVLAPFGIFIAGIAFGWLLHERIEKGHQSSAVSALNTDTLDDAIAENFIHALFDKDIKLSSNASNVWSRADAKEIASFRKVCEASAFDATDGHAVTPILFEFDESLAEIGLSEKEVETLIEIGLVKKAPFGRRLFIINNDDEKLIDHGVIANCGGVTFQLSYGTFRTELVSGRSTGGTFASQWADCVDLGVIEFTSAGLEVASKINVKSNSGMNDYLRRHHSGRKQASEFSNTIS